MEGRGGFEVGGEEESLGWLIARGDGREESERIRAVGVGEKLLVLVERAERRKDSQVRRSRGDDRREVVPELVRVGAPFEGDENRRRAVVELRCEHRIVVRM